MSSPRNDLTQPLQDEKGKDEKDENKDIVIDVDVADDDGVLRVFEPPSPIKEKPAKLKVEVVIPVKELELSPALNKFLKDKVVARENRVERKPVAESKSVSKWERLKKEAASTLKGISIAFTGGALISKFEKLVQGIKFLDDYSYDTVSTLMTMMAVKGEEAYDYLQLNAGKYTRIATSLGINISSAMLVTWANKQFMESTYTKMEDCPTFNVNMLERVSFLATSKVVANLAEVAVTKAQYKIASVARKCGSFVKSGFGLFSSKSKTTSAVTPMSPENYTSLADDDLVTMLPPEALEKANSPRP